MMFLLGVIGATIVILIVYFPILVKRKWWRDIVFCSLFLLAGIATEAVQAFHLDVPNPLKWIIAMHQPIEKAIAAMLGVEQ